MASTTALDRAETLKKEGNAHYALAQYKAAVGKYTAAIHLAPENAVLYSNRCAAWIGLKEYERASQDAAWTIEKHPTWFKGYYRKAQISEKLELFPSAVEEAKMALEYCETEKDRVAMQKLVKQLKQLTKKMVQKENPCTSRDKQTTTPGDIVLSLCKDAGLSIHAAFGDGLFGLAAGSRAFWTETYHRGLRDFKVFYDEKTLPDGEIAKSLRLSENFHLALQDLTNAIVENNEVIHFNTNTIRQVQETLEGCARIQHVQHTQSEFPPQQATTADYEPPLLGWKCRGKKPGDIILDCEKYLKIASKTTMPWLNRFIKNSATLNDGLYRPIRMMISSSIRLAIIGAVGKTMIYQFHAEAVEDLKWALTLLQMARGVLEPKEETDASFALKGNTLRRTFEARLRLLLCNFVSVQWHTHRRDDIQSDAFSWSTIAPHLEWVLENAQSLAFNLPGGKICHVKVTELPQDTKVEDMLGAQVCEGMWSTLSCFYDVINVYMMQASYHMREAETLEEMSQWGYLELDVIQHRSLACDLYLRAIYLYPMDDLSKEMALTSLISLGSKCGMLTPENLLAMKDKLEELRVVATGYNDVFNRRKWVENSKKSNQMYIVMEQIFQEVPVALDHGVPVDLPCMPWLSGACHAYVGANFEPSDEEITEHLTKVISKYPHLQACFCDEDGDIVPARVSHIFRGAPEENKKRRKVVLKKRRNENV